MDGQEADYSRDFRMSTPAKREIARQTSKKASHSNQYVWNFDELAFLDSLNNCLNINSCVGAVDQTFLNRTKSK